MNVPAGATSVVAAPPGATALQSRPAAVWRRCPHAVLLCRGNARPGPAHTNKCSDTVGVYMETGERGSHKMRVPMSTVLERGQRHTSSCSGSRSPTTETSRLPACSCDMTALRMPSRVSASISSGFASRNRLQSHAPAS